MPYKGEQKIFFPTSSAQNVMLIFGDNMRGKTSFLNTIRWCFYGKALGRHLNDIPNADIINVDAAKEGDWNVAVFLKFESSGDEYDLRRVMKPKPMVYKPKSSNDFEIEVMLRKNGNVLRGDQIAYELNQIIPEDIARFFLFDGELLQEYEMLLNDKDEQGKLIKESIEKVLGVPALINARNELDTLLKEARKRQTRDSQHIEGVKRYSDERRGLESNRESLDADLKTLQKLFDENQSKIGILDKELDESRAIQATKVKMDTLKSEIDRLDQNYAELENQRLFLLKDAWKDLIQLRLQGQISVLERKRDDYTQDQKNRTLVEKRIDDLKAILSKSVCPTCEQAIAETKKNNVKSELLKLENELNKFEQDFTAFGALSEKINKISRIRSTGASEKLPAVIKDMRHINLQRTQIENDMEELKEQLRSHDTAEISRKQATRDGLQKHQGTNEKDIKDRKARIEENERKQEQLSKLIESNAEARSQKSTRLVHAYTQLRDIFSESISELRDQLRNSVANLATTAFRSLTTEPTFNGLRINENYGLTIIDREGRDVVQRSAGAEQVVALSLIDGLNRTARKSGPIVMDTPLGRLDLKHRDNILRYLPEMAEQVILLVHEGEIRKDEILDSLKTRIGGVYNISRVSSSESKLVRE